MIKKLRLLHLPLHIFEIACMRAWIKPPVTVTRKITDTVMVLLIPGKGDSIG